MYLWGYISLIYWHFLKKIPANFPEILSLIKQCTNVLYFFFFFKKFSLFVTATYKCFSLTKSLCSQDFTLPKQLRYKSTTILNEKFESFFHQSSILYTIKFEDLGKHVFLFMSGMEFSFGRLIQEAFLSVQLLTFFSKCHILTLYNSSQRTFSNTQIQIKRKTQ